MFGFSGGIEDLAKRLSTAPDHLKPHFLRYDDRICRGQISPKKLLGIYEQTYRKKTGITNFTKYWASFFRPIPSMHKLAHILHKSNIAVGILSNIYPGIYQELNETKAIPSIKYSSVVLSCDIGSVKPEQKIFKLAEKASNTEPRQILLIDDSIDNIQKARKLGWKAILYEWQNEWQILNRVLHLCAEESPE